MTPHDIRATREFLGLTPEQLASELDVTPAVIQAWERGEVAPSKHHVRLLEWQRAVHERQQLMTARGLGECAVARQLIEDLTSTRRVGTPEHRVLDAHLATCPTCTAAAAFAETLPPLPDYPLGPFNRAFVGLSDRISRLPPWTRPAVWGALFIGSLVLLRALLLLGVSGFSWRILALAVLGFLLGGYLGAVGGVVYHFVRPRTRHLRRWGDYLTGVACAGGYMLAFMIPAAIAGEEIGRDPLGWMALSTVAVVFGLAIGHFVFREL